MGAAGHHLQHHPPLPPRPGAGDRGPSRGFCELYPQRTPEALLGELLAAAFEELEASFPYVQGEDVVATDELGDPLYADAGTTPRFLELARKHLHRLQSETPD